MLNGPNITALFDGSFDGFLTIVYAHYYEKLCPCNILLEEKYQQELNMNYIVVMTDTEKANKVYSAFEKKVTADAFKDLYYSSLSEKENKFIDMYHYMILGFKVGKELERYEKYDFVLNVHAYSRNVYGEAHQFCGFCRFAETDQGVFYSDICPKNNVLPILSEHFASRFIDEKWIIHDKTHNLASIYDGTSYAIYTVPKTPAIKYSEKEDEYQQLWVKFFKAIVNEQRVNKKLQKSNMPLRYRRQLTEYKMR